MDVQVVSLDGDHSDTTLIVGVMEGLDPLPGSEIAASVDEGLLEAAGFEGKTGQILKVPHEDSGVILLVGLGEEANFSAIRSASGNAIRKVKTDSATSLLATSGVDDATRAVVEGSLLGAYSFSTYKSEEEDSEVTALRVVDGEESALADAVVTARSTNLARDWVNTPARDKAPERFAEMIETEAAGAGVDVEIWSLDKIEDEGLGGVLGVAAGSDREPRVVHLSYEPDKPAAHLALVGKGITFDTGGLSLKPAASMEEMKDDMSGAAVVSAATIAIAELGLPVRVTCIAPLTDNAVGGDATRPGDVLEPYDGPTIEVLNTDAEGRLILADGLALAQHSEPDLTIDVATLTGAARVALGDKIGAVFASSDDVASAVLDAAAVAGEHFWELPLFSEYRKSLDSNIADIKNISSGRYGAAIVAALFLAEYAGDGDWAHLDIAGPARARETAGEAVKGASGVGVRTLVEVARNMGQAD